MEFEGPPDHPCASLGDNNSWSRGLSLGAINIWGRIILGGGVSGSIPGRHLLRASSPSPNWENENCLNNA